MSKKRNILDDLETGKYGRQKTKEQIETNRKLQRDLQEAKQKKLDDERIQEEQNRIKLRKKKI